MRWHHERLPQLTPILLPVPISALARMPEHRNNPIAVVAVADSEKAGDGTSRAVLKEENVAAAAL